MFEFAAKEGLITRQQIPEIPNAKKTTKQIEESRFPAFSEEHWRIIENKIDEWTETPYKNAKKARVAFRYYLLIMAEIGLRATNEHAKLKWRHVVFQDHKGQEVVDIHVPSKTKTGHRVVSVGPHGAKLLRDWKKLTVYGEPNDPVFANPANGQPVLRYTSAFAKFLKFAGIEHSEDEKSYVPSSTRHSFCSRLREAGLPDQLIARLMGHSSTDMIQRHYGQDLLSAHRDRIVEADNKRRKPKQDLTHLAGAVSSAPNTPRGLALHESDDDGPRIIMTKRGLVAK